MIDKSLNPAPQGIDQISQIEEPLEIEIEDPESVTLHLGDSEIKIEPGEDEDFAKNLAEDIPDNILDSIGADLVADYESDIGARRDWVQTYVDGLELLGLKFEERTEPWDGACGVYHPLLTQAVIKFQAETITSTFPASGPVKTQIIGKETPEKKEAAQRVQDDMNYQLTDVMSEYRPEHERMLWGLGLAGNAFKKVYYDPYLGRQVSMYVPAEDVVVPYGASDLQSAERVTHVMRRTENEIARLQYEGFYRDVDLGDAHNTMDDIEKKIAEQLGFRATTDDRYKLLEMHVDLDLDGYEHKDPKTGELTGIALPYIVTVDKGTGTILSIRRNWDPKDAKSPKKRNHFVHYGYVPGFGFYCFGLIHLIGAFAKSSTSLLRQLVDAGTLSNLPGGFKTRGLRVKGDDTPIAPGEWRDVDVPSGTMRDNFMPLPYKEPSQTLMALLEGIIQEGKEFAGAADLAVSDMSANSPVGTTLAVLERTLKVMTAVQARIHYSMKQEFILLRDIIKEYCPEDYDYEPVEGSRHAKKADYDLVYVLPVSDPNASTMAQKVVQYQAALQLAQGAPQLYNLPYLHRQMLEVLGIPNYQKLVPLEDDMKPRDPVTENQNILKGKPVKAFLYQDHQAHIAVHMAAMQDPKVQMVIQQAMGQNPQAIQALQASMSAHIAEHLGYEYRKQIEATMGANIPSYGQDDEDNQVTIPEQLEVQISQLAAQASQQLLQQNQQEAEAQQAQQTAQDPLVQMQQQEIQLKTQDLQRKAAKDQADNEIAMAKIQLEREKIGAHQEATGAQIGSKIQLEQMRMALDKDKTASKMGVDIAMKEADRQHQKHQTASTQDHAKFLADKQTQLAERQQQQKGGEVKGKKFNKGGKVEESSDYDYEGYKDAVKRGEIKQREGEGEHYPDTYKLPNHITFSDQSKYSTEQTPGGTWVGQEPYYYFHPSEHNLKNTSPGKMAEYFHNYEKRGTHVVLPDGRIVEGTQ